MAAVTRPNVVTNAAARTKYISGVRLLKAEFTGPTTTSLGIPGPNTNVSTYDLFIVWHHITMSMLTPPTQNDRNAAHRGPVFLPWHRFMLRQLEVNLQRVLNDSTFGLPYWDWAADGQLSAAAQRTAPIWRAGAFGGQGTPVANGPFTQAQFPVKIVANAAGALVQTNRGLRRAFGVNGAPTLPRRTNTAGAIAETTYDRAPWNSTSSGFRNNLEGWNPNLGLHNRVHVWVGGDMLPSTSPNDPIFFMNHCNVDRIWEAWMQKPGGPGRVYLPGDTAPVSLRGHRLNDSMSSLLSAPATPAPMLDMASLYVYDSLTV
jgi:tyrosinase